MSTPPRRLSFAVGTSLLSASISIGAAGCTGSSTKDEAKKGDKSETRNVEVRTVNEGPKPEPEQPVLPINPGPESEQPIPPTNPGPEPELERAPTPVHTNLGPNQVVVEPGPAASGINPGPEPEPK